MIVSLNRWEWNRALFFGLIVLIAEVGLATALILRKLAHLDRRSAPDPATLAAIRSTRPPSPGPLRVAQGVGPGTAAERLHHLPRRRVASSVSGVAWVVDQLGSKTSTPIAEQPPGGEAGPDQLPGGRSGGRRRHRPRPGHARRRRRADPQAPRAPRPRPMSVGPDASRSAPSGSSVGVLGVVAVRDATLSTHQPVDPGSEVDVVVSARSEGAERGQSLPGARRGAPAHLPSRGPRRPRRPDP